MYRLLLFSHETTLSGAPLALVHLAGWLQDHGWAVTVAAPEVGPISERLQADGIEVIIDDTFLTDPKRTRLNELVAGFDLVVANTLASWPLIHAAHATGIPVIWYLHETLVAFDLIGKIPEIRPTFALADLLVTPTQQTAQIYRGIARTPIEVVPYGIPEPVATKGAKGLAEPVKFVAIGSYETRKGQDVLVAAITRLQPEVRRRARFIFAGRVLDQQFFEQLQTAAMGLEQVEFGSALDHRGALQLLADSDVLVCASRDETMPISIIEAMALGKGVISVNVGGIAEWLRDGMNGRLIPPNDPDALAEAISAWVEHPEMTDALRATARRTFERHFTLDQFGERFAAAIERTLRREERPEGYAGWVAEYDTPTERDRIARKRELRAIPAAPRISILMPVYNPDLELLAVAIDSVKAQSYEHWELCLADDASTDSTTRSFLESAAASDARIKVTFRLTNGHISAASNSALELATGEWCALLDQDDAFAEDALAWVAQEIAQHPDARLIYSDEDKIDLTGVRSNPFFKTDWNPELFLGQNYINHLGVYQTALLREVGGFREGYEGSQDYDVALRCLDDIGPEQVRHIPRILYHWRMAPGSLAEVVDAKPYAKEAARRALSDHLQRKGTAGRVVACPENLESHRVIYQVPEPAPLVTIIIPMRDRIELLRRCLESLRGVTNYPAFEIVIVDNGSVERESLGYLSGIAQERGVTVLRDDGVFNFSRLNNLAAARARGEILAFLNNDIEVIEPEWLGEMVSHAARPEVGVVGARLWYPDETLQHGGVILGLGGVAGHADHRVPRGHPGYFNRAILQKNCSAVTAACLLTRRAIFEELGGFDERNLSVNFNDIDYCLRVAARGWQIVWTPYANLVHHESASRGHHRSGEEQAQFFREATFMQETHGAALLDDPFYNPNLSLQLPGFDLAFPPRRQTDLLSRVLPET
ncbi:MAG: glycosyltransferase [Verrucomicrobiota bacterium]|nr:glycosyltransferase [Verrucomicrobiota bacterium]